MLPTMLLSKVPLYCKCSSTTACPGQSELGLLYHKGLMVRLHHVHYRPYSDTAEEGLRDSEPPVNGYPCKHQGQARDMTSETCACVIHTNQHTLSAACCLCGYMYFLKLSSYSMSFTHAFSSQPVGVHDAYCYNSYTTPQKCTYIQYACV